MDTENTALPEESIVVTDEGVFIEGDTPEASEPVGEDAYILWDEAVFYERLAGIENLMTVQLIGLAFIGGALIALIVMRFFHVR